MQPRRGWTYRRKFNLCNPFRVDGCCRGASLFYQYLTPTGSLPYKTKYIEGQFDNLVLPTLDRLRNVMFPNKSIETRNCLTCEGWPPSHPIRVRGLKLDSTDPTKLIACRTPCGAWIETLRRANGSPAQGERVFRQC